MRFVLNYINSCLEPIVKELSNLKTLDLFLGSSKFLPRSEINSLADCSSDHLLVSLKLNCFPSWTEIKFRGKWILNNENWPKWEKKLKESLLELKGSLEDKIKIFFRFSD